MDNYYKSESGMLVQQYAVSPVLLLEKMLFIDRYIQASGEERKSEAFEKLRKSLYAGDGGSWVVDGFGSLDTGGKPLTEPGAVWKVKGFGTSDYDSYYQALYYASMHSDGSYQGREVKVECSTAEGIWTVTDEDGNTTIIDAGNGDKSCTVSVNGRRKSSDGYDLAFKTVGKFEVKLEKVVNGKETDYRPKVSGQFFHSLSRDGKVLDNCEVNYKDDVPEYRIWR